MKLKISMLVLALSFTASGAFAQTADDTKWINQCILDNVKEGQTTEVVNKYCSCMNDKMDVNEKLSISEWEKTHKTEEEACSKSAGWVTK